MVFSITNDYKRLQTKVNDYKPDTYFTLF